MRNTLAWVCDLYKKNLKKKNYDVGGHVLCSFETKKLDPLPCGI